jgi:hypothetical protein
MVSDSLTEFEVYSRLVQYLEQRNWVVICGSPPAGTDNRYRKCLLPRRSLDGSDRGPRDEVDLTAHDGEILLLVECKNTLTDSLYQTNRLAESDYMKLKRLSKSFTPSQLRELLMRAHGLTLPSNLFVGFALAVERVNCVPPADITVFELGPSKTRVLEAAPLVHRFGSR